jgi:hypothetical protein
VRGTAADADPFPLIRPFVDQCDIPRQMFRVQGDGLDTLPTDTNHRGAEMRTWWRAGRSAYGAVRHKVEVLMGFLYRPERYHGRGDAGERDAGRM